MEEWDIYDRNLNSTGKTCIRGKYTLKENEYHLVVHVWLFTRNGKILLTKRSPNKETYPLKWECTGGSVIKGETPIEGAIREIKEEIGINLTEKKLHLFSKKRRDRYHDFCFVYYAMVEENIIQKIQFIDGEAIDKKWVTTHEFEKMCNQGEIVNNLFYIKESFNDRK